MVHLKINNCCVCLIDAVVPVEFITGVFYTAMMENGFDIKSIIKNFEWPELFKEKLIAKLIAGGKYE
jgi:hypothetical protein